METNYRAKPQMDTAALTYFCPLTIPIIPFTPTSPKQDMNRLKTLIPIP